MRSTNSCRLCAIFTVVWCFAVYEYLVLELIWKKRKEKERKRKEKRNKKEGTTSIVEQ
jgi:hypothetical protein